MAEDRTLRQLITRENVARLAGPQFFERGERYHAAGNVRSIMQHGNAIFATVEGSENYEVRFAAVSDELRHECSCPVGQDGEFCKHCVAAALAWIETGPGDHAVDSDPRGPTSIVKLDDVRPWLLEQSAGVLADLLLETAERDSRLREKLLRRAALATAKGIDLKAYRRAITAATRTGGFIEYGGAGSYADGVREAIEPVRELLAENPQHAAAVVELVEYALRRGTDALENADDSDGEISGLIRELEGLHLEACHAAKPDPEELATKLFEWEIADHWDVFYSAADTYADLLGEPGLATYRRLAEAAWKQLPELRPGDQVDYESNRHRLTSIMELLARRSGEVDAVAAIKAKDLTSPYCYLEIAQLYHGAHRYDDALAWAERGQKAFPKQIDPRLLEFLADCYHSRERHEDALALIWGMYQSQPSLVSYQRLKHHAEVAGTWAHWRERAIAKLRDSIPAPSSKHGQRLWQGPYESSAATLVRIYLWEEAIESAWSTAQQQQLPRTLWLELARHREKTHPADAIPIYLAEAEALIAVTDKRAYMGAVGHLVRVKALCLALDRVADWNATIARLRLAHRAKRNFIAAAAGL